MKLVIPKQYRFPIVVMAIFSLLMPSAFALVHLWTRRGNLFTKEWYLPAAVCSAYAMAIGALAGFHYNTPRVPRSLVLVVAAIAVGVPAAFLKEPATYVIFSFATGMMIGTDMAKSFFPDANAPTPEPNNSAPK